jgi:type IV pilus assembly protein PilB
MAGIFGLGSRKESAVSGTLDWVNEEGGGEDIKGLSSLYSPEDSTPSHLRDVADVLSELGKLSEEQLASVRRAQKQRQGRDVTEIVRELQFAGEADIAMAQAKLYGVEFSRVSANDVDKEAFRRLEIDYVKSNRVMVVTIQDGVALAATSRPADLFIIEDVKRVLQMNVEVVVCMDEDIEAACQKFEEEVKQEEVDYSVDDIISDMSDIEVVEEQEEEGEDLEKMAGQSPIIKFVNYLISNAIKEGASDIHIEPKPKYTKIRYRIDGVLFETMQAPLHMHPAVVSRIKIMSNLDISERRLPQDGKITVIVGGRGVDLRVSILPTSHGEKAVIRVLDSKSILRGLEELGMETDTMERFSEQVKLPHGILLVTGPTGSGKSTTLYTALSQMDGESLNVSTVEDPVEYELDFCNQVQVIEKIGMTFAAALRSLLRQDPDIIMIGEIRDNETARIGVQAALTGHLVLSTLHTNDAPSSITRLVNIGIDAYLIAASLNAVIAQRLVRKICDNCKERYQVPANIAKYVERTGVKPEELLHGAGCDKCRGSGYVGRVGIYELLTVDDQFRDMINKDPSVSNMRKTFRKSGQNTLFDDGIIKVKHGLTTIEEVLRVTEIYGHSEDEVFVENEK